MTATTVGLAVLAATRQLVWLAVVPVVIGVIGNIVLLGLRAARLRASVLAAPAARSARTPPLRRSLPRDRDRNAVDLQRRRDPKRDVPRRHELGIYAAGYAIPAQLLLITGRADGGRLSQALDARGGRLRDADRCNRRRAGFPCVLPLALGGATVSDQLVRLLYGGSFRRSGPRSSRWRCRSTSWLVQLGARAGARRTPPPARVMRVAMLHRSVQRRRESRAAADGGDRRRRDRRRGIGGADPRLVRRRRPRHRECARGEPCTRPNLVQCRRRGAAHRR